MGWERQAREFGACISYVLVLFASILAFDFEPSNNSERLVPTVAYMVGVDEAAGDPGPDDQFHPIEAPPPTQIGYVRLRPDVSASDGPCAGPQCAYHFDARGPPSAA
jgi:hypothetical protein